MAFKRVNGVKCLSSVLLVRTKEALHVYVSVLDYLILLNVNRAGMPCPQCGDSIPPALPITRNSFVCVIHFQFVLFSRHCFHLNHYTECISYEIDMYFGHQSVVTQCWHTKKNFFLKDFNLFFIYLLHHPPCWDIYGSIAYLKIWDVREVTSTCFFLFRSDNNSKITFLLTFEVVNHSHFVHRAFVSLLTRIIHN